MAKKLAEAEVIETSPEVDLAVRFLRLQAKSKAIFRDMCDMEEELLRALSRQPNERLTLPDGRVVSRKNNYAEKNTCFKMTSVKHFEVVAG